MKKGFILLSLAVFLLILITWVLATSFTTTPTITAIKTDRANQIVNFTITNNNATYNITQVNFTLPSGFTFVSGSNSTNATNLTFINSTTTANWTNSTKEGIIPNQSSAWFSFNVTTPFIFNTVNFTITTVDMNGSANSTNTTITVEPDSVSTRREFGALPNVIYLNWTNNYQSNVTLIANQSLTNNITLEIFNATSFVANYSQSNSWSYCQNGNMYLVIQNASGNISNITEPIKGNASYNNTNFTLIYNTSSSLHPCSPGRYRIGNLMIKNSTNSTENLNISIILDIPISPNSTNYPLNLLTGIGNFSGTIPTNATTYHSYYFNATSMNYTTATNVTSVVINLTGWVSSQDIDIFLLDNSGNLKTKSINKTATSEWLVYNYLPTTSAEMWEIRIYGNSTNASGIPYSGYIIFGTLNLANTTDNQQLSSINFGSNINVTNTSSVNLSLINEGSINFTDIRETKELYYVQRFNNSGSQNISFFVPNSSIATKVKVSLNWTGASNYSFNVYKPDESLALSSMSKYAYANASNVMQEEYNETSDIGGTSGYWRMDVRNNTNITDVYNITAFVYVNASQWINSSFPTSGISLNATGISNYTYNFTVNLTVPNTTLDGKYGGYIQYKASSGATLRIPIEVTTKAGMLLVNNSIGSSTVRVDENIGTNLIKVLNITLNNTGSYPLSIDDTNSSDILNLSATKNISFTYDTPPSIQARGNDTVNITINISTVNTNDTIGVYEGYIKFITNDSYPYRNFTLTLRVNLTNMLIVTFEDISPATTPNISTENKVSLRLNITHINGTALDNPNSMNASNFSSAWLIGSNVSSYRIPTSGSLNISNRSSTVYGAAGWSCENRYCINITIPANSIGGTYEVHLFANYTRNDNKTFGGYGISSNQGKYLTINNTGLYMSTNVSNVPLYPGNSTYYFANITNYGPVASTPSLDSITFTRGSCSEYKVSGSNSWASGCSIAGTGDSTSYHTYNITISNNSICTVWWRIDTAVTNGSDAACTSGNIYGNGSWYPTWLTPSVTVRMVTGVTTGDGTTGGTPTTPTYVADLEFSQAETLVLVQQNSSNTTVVQVNNTGNVSQDITFRVEGINSTWFTMNSSSATLAYKGKTAGFKINFTVGDVEVKDYAGKYNATSVNKTITKDFILRVTPAPAKQVEINDTLLLYKTEMLTLEEKINQSKEKGVNVTLVEAKLSELKSTVEQAENYINQGDYFSAYQLLDDIKSLMNQTKEELETAKEVKAKESRGKIFMWIGIGIGVVVVAALAYLFWPVKGYKPRRYAWIRMPKKENVWDKLKINKLKEKWSKVRKK